MSTEQLSEDLKAKLAQTQKEITDAENDYNNALDKWLEVKKESVEKDIEDIKKELEPVNADIRNRNYPEPSSKASLALKKQELDSKLKTTEEELQKLNDKGPDVTKAFDSYLNEKESEVLEIEKQINDLNLGSKEPTTTSDAAESTEETTTAPAVTPTTSDAAESTEETTTTSDDGASSEETAATTAVTPPEETTTPSDAEEPSEETTTTTDGTPTTSADLEVDIDGTIHTFKKDSLCGLDLTEIKKGEDYYDLASSCIDNNEDCKAALLGLNLTLDDNGIITCPE